MRKLRIKKHKRARVSNIENVDNSIISAMEAILECAHYSKLEENILAEAEEPFALITETLGMTRMQAIIVGMLIDTASLIDTTYMAQYLGVSNIRMLTFMNEIEDLLNRDIIREKVGCIEEGYQIHPDALAAYISGKPFVPVSKKNLSIKAFIDMASDIIEEYKSDVISHEKMVEEIEELFYKNKKLELCKRCKDLESQELILLMFCITKYVYEGDRDIIEHEYNELFDRKVFGRLQRTISTRENILFKKNLLAEGTSAGLAPQDRISVSDDLCEYLNSELGICWNNDDNSYKRGLLNFDDIKEKQMFYNKEDNTSIERLATMLKEENFCKIQQRMEENGMRNGFACLFYGAPGTGKTETALQLARSTGRDIMQVNIAGIKSKWVGESEKNIRSIFNRYRTCCEKCDVKPILLFNEADAIISKRSTSVDKSVDKMENAMQNIILEELEKLNGILIATTNLTSNMDSAFERRFIYKVEFHQPDVTTKKKIWQSMVNGLEENDATVLATEFDLSGGQIENITRKQIVDKILYGTPTTLAGLRDYCRQETLNTTAQRTRIGF